MLTSVISLVLLLSFAFASEYAPRAVKCPSTALTRAANSISQRESNWKESRNSVASRALSNWLLRTDPDFGVPRSYPTLALSSSGGGVRALLTAAGVHKAFDNRDSSVSTSGLYQAITYESGLSGGAWLLSSLAANNWPTVSNLQRLIWTYAFRTGLIATANAKNQSIVDAILAKQQAGFNLSLIDPWSRIVSYLLLYGNDGGIAKQVSDIAKLSHFKDHSMPFPIITSLGTKSTTSQSSEDFNQYEFTPFEFGSWDKGISAFAEIKYLGTDMTNGRPTFSTGQNCITNYDNQGYVLGSSSNLFNQGKSIFTQTFLNILYGLFASASPVFQNQDVYGLYPNPFKGNVNQSPTVSDLKTLTLVDGGEGGEWNPIWPFLHRDVDVLIVSDNSDGFRTNLPTGSKLRNTYENAVAAGLKRMPYIPSTNTFRELGLTRKPTFFGCNDSSKMTIVFLPNTPYTFDSGQPLSKFVYTLSQTAGMIENGMAVATHNGSSTWATCLGCGIMQKSGASMPSACNACLQEFCYD